MDTNTIKEELKGLLADLKTMVFGSDTPSPNQAFAMNGSLDDGTKVMIDGDKPTVGIKVMVEATDGTASPIADGTYKVKISETESIMIVTKDGVITESEMPEEKPAEEPKPETEQMATEQLAALEQRIASIEEALKAKGDAQEMSENTEKVREITVQMSKQIENLTKENSELKDTNKKIVEAFDKFMATPQTPATHKPEETIDTVMEFRKKFGQF